MPSTTVLANLSFAFFQNTFRFRSDCFLFKRSLFATTFENSNFQNLNFYVFSQVKMVGTFGNRETSTIYGAESSLSARFVCFLTNHNYYSNKELFSMLHNVGQFFIELRTSGLLDFSAPEGKCRKLQKIELICNF